MMNEDEIDFVLVSSSVRKKNGSDQKRSVFEVNLQNEGLILEKETYGCLTFLKLHAPKNVLRKYCEIMNLRMPLKKDKSVTLRTAPISKRNLLQDMWDVLKYIRNYFIHGDIEGFNKINIKFRAVYSRDKYYLFDEDNPNFFTLTVRTLVVHYILNRIVDEKGIEPVGLKKLINDEVYIAAYPLHNGDYEELDTTRGYLFNTWSKLKNWYKVQPVDDIQEYLGAKVAFYFSWLGFYTRLLLPISIFGIVVLLYGYITLPSDINSVDTCNKSANIIMCPTCDYSCDYYKISDNCMYSKATYLFDNIFTVAFAFVMAIWASTFFEFWKRYASILTYRWGLIEYSKEEELPRPEYVTKVVRFNKYKINPITGKIENIVPWSVKLPVIILSYTTMFFFIMIALIAVVAVLIYRLWVRATISSMSYAPFLKQYQSLIISGSAATLNLISIMISNIIYRKVAKYLTELELHRTAVEHETSLTIKTFIFQFINYYSSIIYIALFKGKFIGFPGHYNRIFGYRQEECNYGGCLLELSIQLAFIMIGKQILRSIMEMGFPALKQCLKTNALKNKKQETDTAILMELRDLADAPSESRLIKDFKLFDWESVGLFSEYLEMVIQFGFVTLFVPAFPLAPLFALLNNVFEVRLDSRKILTYYRRPIPYRVPGIGVWFYILRFIGNLAVLTNAIVIAFSSTFIPKLIYAMNNHGNDKHFFINSLSVFDVNDLENSTRPLNSSFQNITECMYSDFREPPWSPAKYAPTSFYWQVLMARLIFIILFQNITYAIKNIIDYWIPDEPEELRQLIKKENHLTANLIIKREAELIANCDDDKHSENSKHSSVSSLTNSFEYGLQKFKNNFSDQFTT